MSGGRLYCKHPELLNEHEREKDSGLQKIKRQGEGTLLRADRGMPPRSLARTWVGRSAKKRCRHISRPQSNPQHPRETQNNRRNNGAMQEGAGVLHYSPTKYLGTLDAASFYANTQRLHDRGSAQVPASAHPKPPEVPTAASTGSCFPPVVPLHSAGATVCYTQSSTDFASQWST